MDEQLKLAEMQTGPGFLINLLHFIVLSFLDLLFRVLNRTKVIGQENIPKRGERGVMILSNHISALDPLLIGITAMPRFSPIWWRAAAKEELFTTPFSRFVLQIIGAFSVKRGRHDAGSMDRMAQVLSTSVLVVFPEGTWSTTGQLLPGRLGVGNIIYNARPAKILPVAVKGTDDILPRDHALPRIGRRARIIYGPPMDMNRFYLQPDTRETAREIVQAVMAEIGRLYSQI
ncbi:MAG TPA: lysophospholipid acyltransferase family protein [Nitrospiria bacterium]|nr:lysophospholipid acyltransferase family protein [Nitrospiria bacterium]